MNLFFRQFLKVYGFIFVFIFFFINSMNLCNFLCVAIVLLSLRNLSLSGMGIRVFSILFLILNKFFLEPFSFFVIVEDDFFFFEESVYKYQLNLLFAYYFKLSRILDVIGCLMLLFPGLFSYYEFWGSFNQQICSVINIDLKQVLKNIHVTKPAVTFEAFQRAIPMNVLGKECPSSKNLVNFFKDPGFAVFSRGTSLPRIITKSVLNIEMYPFDLSTTSFGGPHDYLRAAFMHNLSTKSSELKITTSINDTFTLDHGYEFTSDEMRNAVALGAEYLLVHFLKENIYDTRQTYQMLLSDKDLLSQYPAEPIKTLGVLIQNNLAVQSFIKDEGIRVLNIKRGGFDSLIETATARSINFEVKNIKTPTAALMTLENLSDGFYLKRFLEASGGSKVFIINVIYSDGAEENFLEEYARFKKNYSSIQFHVLLGGKQI